MPTQSLVLLGKKNAGSRTTAILHTTSRLTMRLVSAHISQWDLKFVGMWDSALKGNSALRAHVARAAGIELAHSEGQYVIHFFWDMRKFHDSTKEHLLISATCGKEVPDRKFGLGYVDTQITKMSSTWQRIQQRHHWSCIQVVSRAALGREVLLFEVVQAVGDVVLGSVCEEHIDDLSQFVTNSSCMQLLHDATLSGKAVKVGHAELNLVLQIDSLGKRQILGKPDRWPPRGRRCSHVWGSRQTNGNVSGKADVGHPPCSSLSTAQVQAMCRNLKMGTVISKTQACAISQSQDFSLKGECRKWQLEWSKSVSGSRCGGAAMSTRGAGIREVLEGEGSHFGK